MNTNNQTGFSITFLGTCACDYSPRLKTDCKDRFDRDARRSSSLLVNGHILIDCGEHTLDSLRIQGVSYEQITDIFITHLHSDHYNIDHIRTIAKAGKKPLTLFVREDAAVPEIPNVKLVRMTPYLPYQTEDGISVTGLLANHDACVFPQHLLLTYGKKKIFYGCDGAWFLHQTYYHLKGMSLDLMILDCTSGDYLGDFRMGEHNSIPMLRVMLPSLRTFQITCENTLIYFSHLAPSLHQPHEQTVKIAKELGAHVAYDGLTLEL